jgi:hypothetical protein
VLTSNKQAKNKIKVFISYTVLFTGLMASRVADMLEELAEDGRI